MGQPIPTDATAPIRWLVSFDRRAASWWADLIALGARKHVRCFRHVPECDCWLFYDCQFLGTLIHVARSEEARRLVMEWTTDADVLAIDMPAEPVRRLQFPLLPMICTVATSRLIGLPSRALRPDALFQALLRRGATIVQAAGGQGLSSAVVGGARTRAARHAAEGEPRRSGTYLAARQLP
jgi:hypothetical protein